MKFIEINITIMDEKGKAIELQYLRVQQATNTLSYDLSSLLLNNSKASAVRARCIIKDIIGVLSTMYQDINEYRKQIPKTKKEPKPHQPTDTKLEASDDDDPDTDNTIITDSEPETKKEEGQAPNEMEPDQDEIKQLIEKVKQLKSIKDRTQKIYDRTHDAKFKSRLDTIAKTQVKLSNKLKQLKLNT